MGVGPNYGLDKGMLATGSTAYVAGEVVEIIANPATALSTVANAIRRCTTANSLQLLAVVMEDLDTVRLATGKAILDTRLTGIARVKVGSGGVTALDRVKSDNAAGVVTATRIAAGSQPQPILGIALTTAPAAGFADVLLTPGASY